MSSRASPPTGSGTHKAIWCWPRSPADESVLLETLCFHAQQSAEKAIKAALVLHNVPFPKTHNISTLLDLLPPDIPRDAALGEVALLTEYAVSKVVRAKPRM